MKRFDNIIIKPKFEEESIDLRGFFQSSNLQDETAPVKNQDDRVFVLAKDFYIEKQIEPNILQAQLPKVREEILPEPIFESKLIIASQLYKWFEQKKIRWVRTRLNFHLAKSKIRSTLLCYKDIIYKDLGSIGKKLERFLTRNFWQKFASRIEQAGDALFLVLGLPVRGLVWLFIQSAEGLAWMLFGIWKAWEFIFDLIWRGAARLFFGILKLVLLICRKLIWFSKAVLGSFIYIDQKIVASINCGHKRLTSAISKVSNFLCKIRFKLSALVSRIIHFKIAPKPIRLNKIPEFKISAQLSHFELSRTKNLVRQFKFKLPRFNFQHHFSKFKLPSLHFKWLCRSMSFALSGIRVLFRQLQSIRYPKIRKFKLPVFSLPVIFFRKPSWTELPIILAKRQGFALEMLIILLVFAIFGAMIAGKNTVKIVQSEAKATLDTLDNFARNPDLKQTSSVLSAISGRLDNIEANLREIGMLPNYFANYSFFQAGNDLLVFSRHIGNAGTKAVALLDILSKISVGDLLDDSEETDPDLAAISKLLDEIYEEISISADAISRVDPLLLPSKYSDQIRSIKDKLPQIMTALNEAKSMSGTLLRLLGLDRPMRYLLIFQNSGEIRATGGFIGSLAILDASHGKIKITPADVYDYDGQLQSDILPPPGIDKVAKKFQIRDANYWPDFPTSAQMIANLFEKAGGPTVDGVIAFTDTILGDLLAISGPIKLPEFKATFSAKDYYFPLVKLIENKEAGLTTPKKVLFDLIDKIKDAIISRNAWRELADVGLRAISEKKIQVYISDDLEATAVLHSLSLDGQQYIPSEKEDYLHISRTNIGGNKSDRLITEKISQSTQIGSDGLITDTLTVTRTHNWNSDIEREIRRKFQIYQDYDWLEPLIDILGRATNHTYFRVYVPLGSELKHIDGLDLNQVQTSQDGSWTIFSFETKLQAGEFERWTLQYSLPFKIEERDGEIWRYSFEQQAGIGENNEFLRSISVADNWCLSIDDVGECRRDFMSDKKRMGDFRERFLIAGR
ncbi:MAG: DUF4012 domain-containing protein [Patescibacteria group bacterium]|nr:DUF4012 domain-containing protein [Patescibacteria group bacterium]